MEDSVAKIKDYSKTGKANIKIRIPIAKPGIKLKDKSKYNRKPKYKNLEE